MATVEERVDEVMQKAVLAAAEFSQLDQEHTDRIVDAVFKAGFNRRVTLAKMAQEETELGVWQDKVLKNVLATQLVWEQIRPERTVGVLSQDELTGITEYAEPLGPVFAITPVTNPTSTVLYKILICLKARNPIIISPHRRAAKCSGEAARICYEAALAAGAPEDCIQWVGGGSRELTQAFMTHKHLALILATGGTGLVTAAYSSGTPAIGVGPGNVPVFIDRSADLPFTVASIIASKAFDNGTVCASEQAVVMERGIAAAARREFERQGSYFLSPEQVKQVEKVAIDPHSGGMSAGIVGQGVTAIAARAGFSVPAGTKLLIAPLAGVGDEHPLSGEVLAPILAFFEADSYEDAVKLCIALNYRGGIGHSAAVYANDEGRIAEFAALMNAGRVVVNTPSSQGAVGGVFNTLPTAFTLGCGTGGKNITTENITARHLVNIKRICRRRPNERFFAFDGAKYLDESLDADAILAEYDRNH